MQLQCGTPASVKDLPVYDVEMVLANPQAPSTGLSRPSHAVELWQCFPAAASDFTHRTLCTPSLPWPAQHIRSIMVGFVLVVV